MRAPSLTPTPWTTLSSGIFSEGPALPMWMQPRTKQKKSCELNLAPKLTAAGTTKTKKKRLNEDGPLLSHGCSQVGARGGPPKDNRDLASPPLVGEICPRVITSSNASRPRGATLGSCESAHTPSRVARETWHLGKGGRERAPRDRDICWSLWRGGYVHR